MDVMKDLLESFGMIAVQHWELFGLENHYLNQDSKTHYVGYDKDLWYSTNHSARRYKQMTWDTSSNLAAILYNSSFGSVCEFLKIGFIYSENDGDEVEFRFCKQDIWTPTIGVTKLSSKTQSLWDNPQLPDYAKNISVSAKDVVYSAVSEYCLRKAYHGELSPIYSDDFARWRQKRLSEHLEKTIEEVQKDIDAAREIIRDAPDIFESSGEESCPYVKFKDFREKPVSITVNEAAAMDGVSLIYERAHQHGFKEVCTSHGTHGHVSAFWNWAMKSGEVTDLDGNALIGIAQGRLLHHESSTPTSDIVKILRPCVNKAMEEFGLKAGTLLKLNGPITLRGYINDPVKFTLAEKQSTLGVVLSNGFLLDNGSGYVGHENELDLRFHYVIAVPSACGEYMRKMRLNIARLCINLLHVNHQNERHLIDIFIDQNKHLYNWVM